MTSPRYYLEYAALRAACGVVNALPYSAACALARGFASFAFHVVRFQRARTLRRIHAVFPEKSDAECREIALGAARNMFQNIVEMIRAPRLDRAWMDAHVRDIAVNSEKVRALAAEGHGVVIMVPHMGNWDLAAWALARHGVPLFAIAAKQRNPLIDAWMNRQRETGMEVVTRGSSQVMREILARLRRGQAFAILPDLRVPVLDTPVPFLNGTANVSHGSAMFAVATGAPIVVAALRREGRIHTFEHLATLRPRPDSELPQDVSRAEAHRQEAKLLTREAMALIDAAVRKTPDQWFWYNKRWILQPVEGMKPT